MTVSEQWTIAEAAKSIRLGQLSPLELLESCLAQIERYETSVRAWVFIDAAGARAAAERLTGELGRGQWRGPLHGIPVGIKDIFDVFDWPTAAGSGRWAQSYARQDADVVRRLRQAGAIFLGKTVTTAYASFDPPVTRNPWDRERTPGGSSSGSAAAVATGMCLGALASQTGGSTTRPASYCGVPSLKPTFGRLSLRGVLPLAYSLDHVGIIARRVADLAILLQAMVDVGARAIDGCLPHPPDDYLAGLASPSAPLKIGRFGGLFAAKAEPVMHQALENFVEKLRNRGCQVVGCPLPASFAEVSHRHQQVMAVEAAVYHGERLRLHPDDYPPKISSLIEEGLATSGPDYAETKRHQQQLRGEILEMLPDEIDAVLTPATPGPAPDAATTGSPIFNSPWSYTGLPTVSIPIAWSENGLPLSAQLVGRPWSESKLLGIAAWMEQMSGE